MPITGIPVHTDTAGTACLSWWPCAHRWGEGPGQATGQLVAGDLTPVGGPIPVTRLVEVLAAAQYQPLLPDGDHDDGAGAGAAVVVQVGLAVSGRITQIILAKIVVSISNWATTDNDVDRPANAIMRAAKAISSP